MWPYTIFINSWRRHLTQSKDKYALEHSHTCTNNDHRLLSILSCSVLTVQDVMYSPFEWLWLLDMRGYGFCDGKKCTEVQRKYSGTGEEEKERGCSGQEEAVGLSNAFKQGKTSILANDSQVGSATHAALLLVGAMFLSVKWTRVELYMR